MELSSSKQKILDEALQLFSIYGYEATSIQQITDAVGIQKATFYSHFQTKQEILDILIEGLKSFFENTLLFVKTDWSNEDEHKKIFAPYTEEQLIRIIKEQLDLVVHNPFISRMRKFLMIEQFRNAQLGELYHRIEYTDVLTFYKGLIQYLIDIEVFVNDDVEAMALEFLAPISVQINRIQREPECEEDAMRIIDHHIRHLYRMYRR